ncbi:MAG: hypothetical protein PHQ96_02945 [Candidatus Omnitrophica bacterium]|nr:hypothetical protein [Candidatus Omnitrophota bacterium]
MDKKVAIWVIISALAISLVVILFTLRKVPKITMQEEQAILPPSSEAITIKENTKENTVNKVIEQTEKEESVRVGEKIEGPLLN